MQILIRRTEDTCWFRALAAIAAHELAYDESPELEAVASFLAAHEPDIAIWAALKRLRAQGLAIRSHVQSPEYGPQCMRIVVSPSRLGWAMLGMWRDEGGREKTWEGVE